MGVLQLDKDLDFRATKQQSMFEMLEPAETHTSHYFDSLATTYDEVMSAAPTNNWIRDAFRSLVVDAVAPGSLLLDFGCGTGTDAIWYSEHGFRVIAYDNSAGMIERLRLKCAAQISRGEIIPCCTDYEAFLRADLRPHPAAIVSNFAVLSVIPDLPQFFKALAPQIAPSGHAIVSVLNPFFWQDMLHPWWWRACVRSLGKGMIQVSGQRLDVRRYFPTALTAAASPHFISTCQASAGALICNRKRQHYNWVAPNSLAERLERRLWKNVFFRNVGQFTSFILQRSGAQRSMDDAVTRAGQ